MLSIFSSAPYSSPTLVSGVTYFTFERSLDIMRTTPRQSLAYKKLSKQVSLFVRRDLPNLTAIQKLIIWHTAISHLGMWNRDHLTGDMIALIADHAPVNLTVRMETCEKKHSPVAAQHLTTYCMVLQMPLFSADLRLFAKQMEQRLRIHIMRASIALVQTTPCGQVTALKKIDGSLAEHLLQRPKLAQKKISGRHTAHACRPSPLRESFTAEQGAQPDHP
jgi:hypothetical protein